LALKKKEAPEKNHGIICLTVTALPVDKVSGNTETRNEGHLFQYWKLIHSLRTPLLQFQEASLFLSFVRAPAISE